MTTGEYSIETHLYPRLYTHGDHEEVQVTVAKQPVKGLLCVVKPRRGFASKILFPWVSSSVHPTTVGSRVSRPLHHVLEWQITARRLAGR